MKRPRLRLRLRWLVPLGLCALPPLLWVLLLMIIPTDWARGRIVARLSQASGRSVRLESLRVGALGGVRLTNLSIGAPKSGDDPWLTVADAQVNVNLLQLMTGHIDPTEIRVDGISLRVRRRRDGSLELSDLLRADPAGSQAASADPPASTGDATCPGPTGLEVWVSNARIEVIDEPSQTRLEFKGVEGRATCAGRRATVHDLKGTVNGGPFELAAQLDRTGVAPSFEGQLRARDVALSEGMNLLGYVVAPALSATPDTLNGRLAVNVYVRGQGATREAIVTSLVGHGGVILDPIQLDQSKLLAELAPLVELPSQGRVGSVHTDFLIKDRRISTEDLTLSLGTVPLVLAGWTDLDGRLNYRLRSEVLTERLPAKTRDMLADLSLDLNQLTSLKVQGTLDKMVVTLDGVPLGERAGRRDERQRYRELGRKLRDRIFR